MISIYIGNLPEGTKESSIASFLKGCPPENIVICPVSPTLSSLPINPLTTHRILAATLYYKSKEKALDSIRNYNFKVLNGRCLNMGLQINKIKTDYFVSLHQLPDSTTEKEIFEDFSPFGLIVLLHLTKQGVNNTARIAYHGKNAVFFMWKNANHLRQKYPVIELESVPNDQDNEEYTLTLGAPNNPLSGLHINSKFPLMNKQQVGNIISEPIAPIKRQKISQGTESDNSKRFSVRFKNSWHQSSNSSPALKLGSLRTKQCFFNSATPKTTTHSENEIVSPDDKSCKSKPLSCSKALLTPSATTCLFNSEATKSTTHSENEIVSPDDKSSKSEPLSFSKALITPSASKNVEDPLKIKQCLFNSETPKSITNSENEIVSPDDKGCKSEPLSCSKALLTPTSSTNVEVIEIEDAEEIFGKALDYFSYSSSADLYLKYDYLNQYILEKKETFSNVAWHDQFPFPNTNMGLLCGSRRANGKGDIVPNISAFTTSDVSFEDCRSIRSITSVICEKSEILDIIQIPHLERKQVKLKNHSETGIVISGGDNGTLLVWNTNTWNDKMTYLTRLSYKELLSDCFTLFNTSSKALKLCTTSICGNIQIWDVTTKTMECKVSPSKISNSFSPFGPSFIKGMSFSSGGQIGCFSDSLNNIAFWDFRSNSKTEVLSNPHCGDVSYIHCNPLNEYRLLSGATSGEIKCWDVRKLKALNKAQPYLELKKHHGCVNAVKWSPHSPGYFCSASSDTTVVVWNTKNSEESPDVFYHLEHKSPVVDLEWCPKVNGTIASVSSASSSRMNASIQVWKCNPLALS